jgi:uncharacterized protein with HEPN domain
MARPEKGDPGFLLDMLLAAEDAIGFVAGMDEAAFRASALHQAAVLRCVSVIGEAANRVSKEFRSGTSQVPWKAVIGMRHKLVHDYAEVRLDVVWRVVSVELPALAAALRPLVPAEPR